MNKVVSENKEDFRTLHQRGIGSSEIASVVGVNTYQTAYLLWEVKTGRSPQFEGNKYTRAGHMLEPVIVEYFREETGAGIEKGFESDITFFHKHHPHILCTPDRFFELNGKRGIVECKSTQRRIDPEELPMSWMAQLQYQLGICGLEFGAIAWLERGLEFGYVMVDFNQGLFDALVSEANEFWKHVKNDTPPPAQNSSDICRIYNTVKDKRIIATNETYDAYLKLNHVRGKMAELEEQKYELEEQLKMILKDAEVIIHNDEPIITWKECSTTRIRTKELRENRPEIYESYKYSITQRRFLVK